MDLKEVKELAIHGAGYIGLSGGVYLALSGVRVRLYDPEQSVVDLINKGKSHVPRLAEFIGFDFKPLVDSGALLATNKFDEVKDSLIHIIAVPTEKNAEPYMDIALSVCKKLIECHSQKMQPLVIIMESTLQPGTAKLIAQMFKDSGFELGRDSHFVVAPRRDWFVNSEMNVKKCTRVVGGWTQRCAEIGKQILRNCSDDIRTASTFEVAEMVKSMENSLLHIPVTFAMQVAEAYPNVDVDEVLALAGTHWRLPAYHIGAGVAGYCVPLGTKYIVGGAAEGKAPSIAKDALLYDQTYWRQNLAKLLLEHSTEGGTIGILGISYKAGFKVHALSPAIGVTKTIREFNVAYESAGWHDKCRKVWAYDPFYPTPEIQRILGDDVKSTDAIALNETLSGTDALLIVCGHHEFKDITKYLTSLRKGMYVLDGTGVWKDYEKLLTDRGIKYHRIGQAGWTNGK